jgi:uncharacterized protein
MSHAPENIEAFESGYLELRNIVEARVTMLTAIHATQLQCRRGCDQCCTDIALHQCELTHIRHALQTRGFAPPDSSPAPEAEKTSCIFLRNQICTIYENRPIICRVHGLPLAYPVQEYDATGAKITNDDTITNWCELNFTSDDAGYPFGLNDCIDMRWIEARLTSLDEAYYDSVRPSSRTMLSELNSTFPL